MIRSFLTTILVLSLCCCSPNSQQIEDKNTYPNKDSTKHQNDTIMKSISIMEEDRYWSIVSASLVNSNNQDEQVNAIRQQLKDMSTTDIIGFNLRTDLLTDKLYTSDLWCAAYIINGGCSDDCFVYFRRGIVSLGKEVYYNTLKDPDYLVNVQLSGSNSFEFESYAWAAEEAYEFKTGNLIYDGIDYETFNKEYRTINEIDFNWQEENPDWNPTAIEMIRKGYEQAGYKMPDIIFWNINSRGDNIPVKKDELNTALVSGFSPSILQSILAAKEITPYSVMMETIDGVRYRPITV